MTSVHSKSSYPCVSRRNKESNVTMVVLIASTWLSTTKREIIPPKKEEKEKVVSTSSDQPVDKDQCKWCKRGALSDELH
jgi:hypothetical protein